MKGGKLDSMKRRWLAWSLGGASLGLTACGDQATVDGLVAQAGEHRLTADQVVDLLVDEEQFPAQDDVVRALVDLWIDYTLLGEAVAEDSMLSRLDFGPLVRQQIEQTMVVQLRDSVIQVDTVVSDSELRAMYESTAPDARLRARHILLSYPPGSTQAARDSVRAEIEEIRGRIVAGESFEALARAYSQDQGSAALGGDLGFFGRGDMVRPFDEAVFALQPGEVSEPVESPFGVHLIRLEEREIQGFEDVADAFRRSVQSQRNAEAESTYVTGLGERAAPEVREGATDVLRELARDPGARLSRRAERRALVTYTDGAVTVGDIRDVLRSQSAQYRDQVQQGTDEQLEDLLLGLLRRQLLVEEARGSGLAPTDESVDSALADARGELRQVAQELGLTRLDVAPGEPVQRGIARAVTYALRGILNGASDVVPLGPIAFQLRERVPTAIYDAGVGQAILGIARVRAGRGLSPLETALDSAALAPDSAGA